MKQLIRIFKWIVGIVGGLLLLIALTLGIIGVPEPTAITSKHVPRINWTYAADTYRLIQKRGASTRFATWNATDKGMYVWAKGKGFRPTLQQLSHPKGNIQALEGIPPHARNIQAADHQPFLIYALDQAGDERWQLYRFDLDSMRSVLLSDGEHRFESPLLDPSGQRLAYISNKGKSEDREMYVMDPTNPSSESLIVEVDGTWVLAEWSPNGNQILAAQYVSVNEMYPYIIHVDSQSIQPFALEHDSTVSYGAALWNGDASKIYYTSDYQSEFKHLRYRDLDSGKDRSLTRDIPWNVTQIDLSPDGQQLAFLVNEDALSVLYLMDTQTGQYHRVEALPFGSVTDIHFHPQKELLAITHTLSSGLSSIYTYDLISESLDQWTTPLASENALLPVPELIHFSSFDVDTSHGKPRDIAAFFHRPSTNIKKPYPVLISIHGGPESQAGLIKGPLTELLFQQGMAVLVPNVRGSTGYGNSFTDLDNGKLRENSVKDIGALLDWIATQPDLDKEKVVLVGGSYGGYMVLASAVHYSDRLLCGIDLYGISNFVSFLENTEAYRRDVRRVEYGDERNPEMRAFLESISPLAHTEDIQIPLLIYQGNNDPRVPVSESRQMVEKLLQEGKEVWYMEASNEGHSLRQPMNQLYVRAACVAFVWEQLNRRKD